MPGLTHPQDEFINYDSASNNHNDVVNSTTIGFWSKHRGDISSNQLQKFWNDLSLQARQELLRIDKQSLFERARKNMYCSRCNGLLLEGFSQIVMYGKSLQQEGQAAHDPPSSLKNQNYHVPATTNGSLNDTQDPSVHPWGGLTTTRDGMLTLLDCYLYSKSLKGLYNVFDSAHARERERELLYPDACGGGARGWISQGIVSYGRGHGTRETCALHTARLSCDTLVDFWSALGDETRQSLLRMKEENFIERLMFRFESKRFCRDCRRNVIREFKELKELKRIRKEPRCTSCFCVADTAFQYQVSNDRVQADWHQSFTDAVGTYHHFEWAIGTGEGKSDILEFENVGMNRSVQVNGLNLTGLSACYITLRAWKLDGRCTELSVKAHALKGQQCVHGRLVVGDGYVTIARGETIRRFFEHAEEVEEEEDDDSMDKDGNEQDGECSRPQKHAKSPELAREFLLDAATVIFKEQVEKAFREGTARQNAHSIFVCLALKLLEERVHVACKEIVTLEKQMKLLEEEEKEKREEEERKERRKVKEREKKLRRKERLKGKERDKEKACFDSSEMYDPLRVSKEESSTGIDEDPSNTRAERGDSMSETGDIVLSTLLPSDVQDELCSDWYSRSEQNHPVADEEDATVQDGNDSFAVQNSRFSQHQHKFWKASQKDSASKWYDKHRFVCVSESVVEANKSEPKSHKDNFETYSSGRQFKSNSARSNLKTTPCKYGEKFHSSKNRLSERCEFHFCSCSTGHEYRAQAEPNTSAIRSDQDSKDVNKCGSSSDSHKLFRHRTKFNQLDYICHNRGRSKSRTNLGNQTSSKDSTHTKKVWEPTQSQKKYPRSNSDSDLTIGSSSVKIEGTEIANLHSSCVTEFCGQMIDEFQSLIGPKVTYSEVDQRGLSSCDSDVKSPQCPLITADKELCSAESSPSNRHSELIVSSASSSDSCSSCLSEGDSNTATSNPHNHESLSTSDSEDASQLSEGRETSDLIANVFSEHHQQGMMKKKTYDEAETLRSSGFTVAPEADSGRHKPEGSLLPKAYVDNANGKPKVNEGSQHQAVHSYLDSHNMHFSSFQAPAMGYYQQNAISWPVAPANGLMAFPHPNHYLFSSPLGCGLNDSGYYMQYGGLPYVASPFLNPSQVPVFHPVAAANGVLSEEELLIPEASQVQGYSNEASKVRGLSAKSKLTEPPHNSGGDQKDHDPPKMVGENNGFSLFHFGGPVALSTSLKEGTIEDFSSNNSAVHVEMDHGYSKKDTTIEEYNLFKTSNGLRFSFF